MTKFHQIFFSRPLFYIAILFILGIIFAKFVSLPFILVLSLVCLVSLACLVCFILKKQFLFYLALFLAIFLVGSLLYQNSLQLPSNHIAQFSSDESELVLLKGLIVNDPINTITRHKTSKSSFILEANKLKLDNNWQEVKGKVKVTVFDHPTKLCPSVHNLYSSVFYGDLLILEGKLSKPHLPTNPGQFNYRKYLIRQRIHSVLTVKKAHSIKLIDSNQGNFIMQSILRLKHKFKDIIYKTIPQNEARLLSAMILGDREYIPYEIKDRYVQSGTIHILAISGLHIGLVMALFMIIFKLFRIPQRASFILLSVLLTGFALLTGARIPVIRATIMAQIFIFGFILYRDQDFYNTLSLAALAILIFNPHQLFNVGFQLSFLAVFSIVCFSPRIEKLFKKEDIIRQKYHPLKKYLIKSVSVSFAAWIGIMPLILYYFNIFSPVTILANLIVVPIMFVVILLALTLLLSGLVSIQLASLFSILCWFSLLTIDKIALFFSNLKFSHIYLPSIPVMYIFLFYLFLVIWINSKKLKISKKSVSLLFLIIIIFLTWTEIFKKDSNLLEITFLDVGHGDSIFIKAPCGKNILIDSGREGIGRRVISPFLWSKGIRKIDITVLTHPEADHCGGFKVVYDRFVIKNSMDNGRRINTLAFSRYANSVKKEKSKYVTLMKGLKIAGLSELDIYILNPPEEGIKARNFIEDNNSVVIKIVHRDTSLLLCGDIREETIKNLILSYGDELKVDILKFPHHGRISKQGERLLISSVNPEVIIVSGRIVSKEFSKFRSVRKPRLLATLKPSNGVYEDKIETIVTKKRGSITVYSDGEEYWIESFKRLIEESN